MRGDFHEKISLLQQKKFLLDLCRDSGSGVDFNFVMGIVCTN